MVATTNKSLPLMATGDQVDTWGSVLNAQVFSVLDSALGSPVAIALSNANITLTTSQLQNLILQFSGTLTANVTVTIPSGVGGFFVMSNVTTGNFTVTISSGGGGTSQILPRNYNAVFYCDGTNVLNPTQPLGQFTDIAGAATVDIGTVPSGLVNVTGNGAMIASFGSTARTNQSLFQVKFADVNTIVNGANLACPGGVNITTAANNVYTVWYNGSGVYRILGGMLASGQPIIQSLVQRAYQEYTTYVALTTTLPADDTVPQITEGTQILSLSFTPMAAGNILRVSTVVFGGGTTPTSFSVALFSGSTCINAVSSITNTGTYTSLPVTVEVSAGSTAARTISVRVGCNSGNAYVNGSNNARAFGGAARSVLIVEELTP